MSNLAGGASNSRRTRIFALLFIIGLAIFATIVIVESSSLQWPLASEIQNVASHIKPPISSNSSIFISAKNILPPQLIAQPIIHAQITIYTFSLHGLLAVASGFTNGLGEQTFIVAPNDYEVKMTSQIANTSTVLTTNNGNTTELDIFINETAYPTSFVDVYQSISPDIIAPWDNMYITVPSDSLLLKSGTNESIYLEFVPSSCAQPPFCNGTSQKYGASVINEYSSLPSGTVWLQIELNTVANISTNSSVYVLTSVSSYTLKEYFMNNATL
jgi:hypothetical protein